MYLTLVKTRFLQGINKHTFELMDLRLKILIIDDVHESLLHRLKDLSIDYTYSPEIAAADVAKTLHDYQGIVVRSKIYVGKDLLKENPQLKLICRVGSGMDNIDVEETDKLGIDCINAPEANCDSVAEQTIGMLLSLLHNINKGSREVSENVWDREGNRGRELNSLTVGIIGYGHTGSAVARKLSGFGCEVVAYDKYVSDFGDSIIKEVSYDQLIDQADVISFHVPLTSETKGWINAEFIASVNQPFYLLNLSRGKIMRGKDVLAGIKNGKILGFAADVLENENLDGMSADEKNVFDQLKTDNQVVLTPHVGGWSKESYKKLSVVIGDKIEAWLKSNEISENSARRNGHFVG